ncbi:unnamed protein product [Acanthoscelides obtectus]|uniref:Single domain-containing protein n=1 Tax=Acanthoscelides obtectus TaxID=200917 RepID=A0A9P0K8E4_ACAOB|nr:unnamed protein product [Acanthoscelides obtectus]CAK1665919.1 hypothetical protein AOBTE_LOCUS25050 [Acanthoscelides obtectus]
MYSIEFAVILIVSVHSTNAWMTQYENEVDDGIHCVNHLLSERAGRDVVLRIGEHLDFSDCSRVECFPPLQTITVKGCGISSKDEGMECVHPEAFTRPYPYCCQECA